MRSRLCVEHLEDRLTPNNRFVMPVGAAVDNVTYFPTLATALTTAGLNTGDVIQIEPGSSPGNVTSAVFTLAFTTATTLTIRGDSVVPAAFVPQFTLSEAVTIAANRTLLLDNVSLGLVSAGSLRFNGNTTISHSVLADVNSSASEPFVFAGQVDNLTNCTLVNNTPVGNALLRIATHPAGTSHTIRGNTFVSHATISKQLAWANGSGVAVTDVLADNTFIAGTAAAGANTVTILLGISGLTIRGNRFSGPFSYAVDVAGNPTGLQVLNNQFDLTGSNSCCITVSNGTGTTSATVANNVFRTSGTGLGLQAFVGSGPMTLKVEGNDFHANRIGVELDSGANSLANVDFGGGTQGSLGGNNFRSFTAPATSNSGVIIADASTGTLQAQRNLFRVPDPQTVIFSPGAGAVNTGGQLTGNAAFVQALYTQFLRRTGDTNNANDAGFWVNQMAGGMSQATVANGIVRSAEAYGYVVDDLYRTILKREADAFGRQLHINLLAGGWTVEQVQAGLLGGGEYAVRFPGDAHFVSSLFVTLLGRVPSASDVSTWVNALPSLGRSGVASGFLNSTEYRVKGVSGLFTDVLKRTAANQPTATQVGEWVNTGLDLYTLRVLFASSAEFYIVG